MGNLKNGEFDLSKLEYLEDDCIPNDEDFVKKGDFLFNTRNTLELVGKGATWFGESDKYAFNSNIARFVLKNINTFFYNYLYNTAHVQKQIRARATGTTSVAAIYPKSLDSIKYFVPSLDEQSKLARYFQILDNLITLHQRKPKLLCSSQNFYLVSEYAHPWEQRKLSDISERVTRKNKNLEYSLPLTISAQYGLVDQHEFFNKRIAAKDVSGYYVIKNGEFAYNKSYSEGYPWGAVKRLDRYENGVLSTLYILFSVKNVDSDFLVSYYDTNNWHSEVQQRSAEGARNHGLLNISASDFFDTELVIPQDPNEQKKIGLLFKKLDSTITLHQR